MGPVFNAAYLPPIINSLDACLYQLLLLADRAWKLVFSLQEMACCLLLGCSILPLPILTALSLSLWVRQLHASYCPECNLFPLGPSLDPVQDMEWCQQYAFHNRRFMLDLLASAVEKVTKRTPETDRIVNR